MIAPKIASFCAVFALIPALAGAQTPPVDVQVVAGDDEEDFFEDAKAPKASEPEEEKTAAPSVKVQKRGDDGSNVNTNVVNVVIGGQQQSQKAEATNQEAEVESLEQDLSVARERVEARRPAKAEAAAPKDESPGPAHASPDGSHSWWRSWNKAPGVRQGDVLLSALGGRSATGGYWGAALELMIDDHFGLRGKGFFDLVGGHRGFSHREGGGWRFTDGGRWAGLTSDAFGGVDRGVVHMLEAQLSYHFRPQKRFDPYATLGASHFGWWLGRGGGDDIGGGAYLRAGAGFNWFWRSLFAGAEVGWYPVELFRYSVERGAGSSGRDAVVHISESPSAFDGKRATFSAHVGLRF